MQLGSAWTKTNKEGDTYISVSLDDTIKELFPQLKELRIVLSYLSERKSDNAPHWKVSAFVPKVNNFDTANADANESILKDALPSETEEVPY